MAGTLDERGEILKTPAASIVEKDTTPADMPWLLQQYFNGEVDPGREFARQYPNMPLMASIGFRSLQAEVQHGVATLMSQDRAATLQIEVRPADNLTQFAFTMASMLTLRFQMATLSDLDRARWLEIMRREEGGIGFLWGQERWQRDYLISVTQNHRASLVAASPGRIEAAARLTPEVTLKLLDWLAEFWQPTPAHLSETPDTESW